MEISIAFHTSNLSERFAKGPYQKNIPPSVRHEPAIHRTLGLLPIGLSWPLSSKSPKLVTAKTWARVLVMTSSCGECELLSSSSRNKTPGSHSREAGALLQSYLAIPSSYHSGFLCFLRLWLIQWHLVNNWYLKNFMTFFDKFWWAEFWWAEFCCGFSSVSIQMVLWMYMLADIWCI